MSVMLLAMCNKTCHSPTFSRLVLPQPRPRLYSLHSAPSYNTTISSYSISLTHKRNFQAALKRQIPKKMPPAPPKLRILCFGDSLTEGYSRFGLRFTPYSTTLVQRLQEEFGQEQDIEIVTDGVSGQAVTAGFLRRMKRHCKITLFPFLYPPTFHFILCYFMRMLFDLV